MTRNCARNYAEIGIVSEGTLREDDLLSAYLNALRSRPATTRPGTAPLIREASALLACDPDEWTDEQQDSAPEMVSELADAIQESLPDYLYFGSTEGDGACIGIWPALDSLEYDRRVGDCPNRDALPPGYTGPAVDVSDRGNITMYHVTRGRARETWSCV